MAAYNGEKYIREQIHSVLSQVDVDLQLKVFDDQSNDNTIIEINSVYDPRIEIFQNEVNTGSAASNFILALLQIGNETLKAFDYISFADQDDIWFDTKLKSAIDELSRNDAALYASNLICWNSIDEQKIILKKSHEQKKFDYLFEGGSAGCTYVFTVQLALDFVSAIPRIDLKGWKYLSHDWLLYFYARLNSYKVYIDQNSYILYRIHDSNVHGQLNTLSLFALKGRLKLINEGWYFKQAEGFKSLLSPNSDEYRIYKWYSKNYFTRLYVILRYNFSLIRSPKKAFIFFMISLFPSSLIK